MGRLVTALCEYVSIEDVIGKETLEEGTLKCKASMEKFQQSIPSNPPETEGVLSSEQSTNGSALMETQPSQDVINQQGKLKSLLDSCMWTVSRRKRGRSLSYKQVCGKRKIFSCIDGCMMQLQNFR